LLASAFLLLTPLVAAQEIFSEADFDKNARQVVPRDAFPVLNNPEMTPAAKAGGKVLDEEPVIGVVLNGEAKAYPISVMGSHELANDTCGGKPIAVSW